MDRLQLLELDDPPDFAGRRQCRTNSCELRLVKDRPHHDFSIFEPLICEMDEVFTCYISP